MGSRLRRLCVAAFFGAEIKWRKVANYPIEFQDELEGCLKLGICDLADWGRCMIVRLREGLERRGEEEAACDALERLSLQECVHSLGTRTGVSNLTFEQSENIYSQHLFLPLTIHVFNTASKRK